MAVNSDRKVSRLGDRRERAVPCTLCQVGTWNLSAKCDPCLDREERERDELPGLATP